MAKKKSIKRNKKNLISIKEKYGQYDILQLREIWNRINDKFEDKEIDISEEEIKFYISFNGDEFNF